MAEASCSGTTPFKRLIDQQSRDVSHHQDRLVNGGGQSHGSFRSTSQPQQGQNGFNSFMDGPSTLPGISHHHAAGRLAAHAAALDPAHAPVFAPGHAPQFQAPQAPAVDVGNWAADFSRFSGQQQQQRLPPQQNAFQQPAPQMHMGQPVAQYNLQTTFGQPMTGFAPLYGPTNGGFMDPNVAVAQRPAAEAEFDQEMDRWMASHGDGKEMDDVDAIMDQMARELELNEGKLAEAEIAEQEILSTTEVRRAESSHLTDLETPEIGNLSLGSREEVAPEQTEAPREEPGKAKSELSEAAERLLESVQHEEGEKWKNSVFLSLMRDFRDGRKDIVGDKIQNTPENETDAARTAN